MADYLKTKEDYDNVVSTEEEISKFMGGMMAGGTVSWHIPHEVHKIPDTTIQTYSPPVGASIQLEVKPSADPKNGYVGKFTKFARWDTGATDTLKRLELKYDKVAESLVAFDIKVSDLLLLKEYRVHRTHLKGRLRDVLIWEDLEKGTQYSTSYVWCGDYIEETPS